MKILLLGSNGMLGKTIYKKLTSLETEVSTVARSNADYCFDLTDDARLESCIKEERPAVVINAAAIVDIEFCEKNPGLAYQINTRIPGVLADICKRKNIYLVHISTDHYYCGDGSRKHKETDPVTLVNEYARTKYLGEQLILAHKDSLILRTNIIGFKGDKKKTYNIEIDTTNWTAQNTKTITIEGIEETDIVNLYPVWSENKECRRKD